MHFCFKTNKQIPTCLLGTASLANLQKSFDVLDEKLSAKEKAVSAYCMKHFFYKTLSWEGNEVRKYRRKLKAATK